MTRASTTSGPSPGPTAPSHSPDQGGSSLGSEGRHRRSLARRRGERRDHREHPQRFTQPLLGSTSINGNSFPVREKGPANASNNVGALTSFADIDSLASQRAVATQRLVQVADGYANQDDANWQAFKTATGN